MTYHLLFEQSGTFKNVLKEKGFAAFDYDILNDFGETDFQIDIFEQIDIEYSNIINNTKKDNIFQRISNNDFIIAFFPCTHFSGLNQFQYKLLIAGKKREVNIKSIERLRKRNLERTAYFDKYLKFCLICKMKGIKTIIENPASCSGNHSFLELFSPINIGYYEKNRQLWGDKYKKPTNYFSINFDMKEKFCMFSPAGAKRQVLKDEGMKDRSMITKLYAEKFYKRFLEVEVKNE